MSTAKEPVRFRKNRRANILVLGAGYAGLRCVLDLAQVQRATQLPLDITLIDRNPYHQVVTQLHRTATEAMDSARAALPIKEILPEGVRFVQAEVRSLLLDDRLIETSRGLEPYEHLVIALGSETSLPAIPGLKNHALPLRWWKEAEALRRHIRDCFAAARAAQSRKQREPYLRIVVAGGGFTGCQLAGELSHWATDLADEYAVPVQEIHLLLVEQADRLLPGGESTDGDLARAILLRKGVDVRLNCPLSAVHSDRLALGKETVPARTVVWTGGIQTPEFLAQAGLQTAKQGRVVVDRYLKAERHPKIRIAGDCAFYELEGRALPATAAQAVRQGAYLAESIASEIGSRPIKAYVPLDTGLLVSLGGDDAVGDLLGVPLAGLAACTLKEAIERWYAFSVEHGLPVLY